VSPDASRDTVFETERLRFCRFHVDDAPAMFELNADPEVLRHTGDPPFESVDAARALIESYREYEEHGMGRWSVCLLPEERYVGWCGLKLEPGSGEVDLGFRFLRRYWNRGIATEAGEGTLRYGFESLELDRIVGRARPENPASCRVLEKLGMRRCGEIERDGAAWLLYEILRGDWRRG
jgi:RimJ/RimL family protein N-acetyltransferase